MHILVVRDNPIVADVPGMTLEEAGYFKTTAHSIEPALFELRLNQIDAVLMDLNLPDGDRAKLARLIRKNHMPVPILVVSGNSGIDGKITTLDSDADGYLTKPFDRYELVTILTQLSNGRMVTVQPPSMSDI